MAKVQPAFGLLTSFIRPAKYQAHFFSHNVSGWGQPRNSSGCLSLVDFYTAAALSYQQHHKSVNRVV